MVAVWCVATISRAQNFRRRYRGSPQQMARTFVCVCVCVYPPPHQLPYGFPSRARIQCQPRLDNSDDHPIYSLFFVLSLSRAYWARFESGRRAARMAVNVCADLFRPHAHRTHAKKIVPENCAYERSFLRDQRRRIRIDRYTTADLMTSIRSFSVGRNAQKMWRNICLIMDRLVNRICASPSHPPRRSTYIKKLNSVHPHWMLGTKNRFIYSDWIWCCGVDWPSRRQAWPAYHCACAWPELVHENRVRTFRTSMRFQTFVSIEREWCLPLCSVLCCTNANESTGVRRIMRVKSHRAIRILIHIKIQIEWKMYSFLFSFRIRFIVDLSR